MARLLLFVRHGSTGDEYARRYIGRTDVSLDAAGRNQATALGGLLKTLCPARCYSSPLRRALETAQPAAALLELRAEVDPDLREVDFGLWEGKSFEEIERTYPEAVSEWAALADGFAFPGGESLRDFVDRVRRVADRMVADPADAVLAVTHGGVIRMAICHL
ncbi:histidine phosphatase family protein, partial [Candidatus Sumerlaeota bacterium]|nr:histidine phosphatase family protein [Candidatus Sumerlaeota bacterium]